jgi:hypothetical protein
MAFRMQTPWKNPRSDKLWFRRRVPAHLVAFMGRREIKFSLGTADPELARIRFQEENAKLERMWHEHLNGRQYVKLSQRQISALAGEFYREMVFRHRDDPGKPLDWELVLKRDREKIAKRFPLQGRAFHMRLTRLPDRWSCRHLSRKCICSTWPRLVWCGPVRRPNCGRPEAPKRFVDPNQYLR